MLCRLCNQTGKFTKSHIIPEAFFRELRIENVPPTKISNTLGRFPKRSPIGVYDQEILCEECEPKFSTMDDYGIKVLLKQRDEFFEPVIDSAGREVASQSKAVDQHLLLVFLIGTLWRASVSKSDFFKRIELGPYEEEARQVVLNQALNVPKIFAAALTKWSTTDENQYIARSILDPIRETNRNPNRYRFYFGKIVAYIKVDQREFEPQLKAIALCMQDQLTLANRDFGGSKEFRLMQRVAAQSDANERAAKTKSGRLK